MAKVTVQVLGSESATVVDDVVTVSDVLDVLGLSNHTATVNGVSSHLDDNLETGDFVDLAPSVKGG